MAAPAREYTEADAPRAVVPADIVGVTDGLGGHLFSQGWVTIPLLDASGISNARDQISDVLARAPEFVDDLPPSHRFSMTGFAALAYPSSFHNYIVRILRKDAAAAAKPVLRALADRTGKQTHMDQYVDRLMVRQGKWPNDTSGQAATAEAWHRDESVDEQGAAMPDDDVILGGWLNLNATEEFLLCSPTTHFTDRNQGGGFGPIKDDAERRRMAQKLRRVVVPPGNLLMFFENTAHMVASRTPPAGTTQLRLFTGFRLTNSHTPIYTFLERTLREMDVMRLKSGQTPPSYSRLNWVNGPVSLDRWTKATLRPELREQRKMLTGTRAGTTYTIPVGGPMSLQQFPSLRQGATAVYAPNPNLIDVNDQGELNEFDAYYPPYDDEEIRLYTPHPLQQAGGVGRPVACDTCGQRDALMYCEGCEGAYYCNVACQTKDWIAGHQITCFRFPTL